MIKNIIASALAGLALVMPGQARLESGTKPLLDLMETGGIAIRYNTSECDSDEYLGLYRHSGMRRAMILCYGVSVDAEDHMVVRHEAIHAIQHCVNTARGTDVFTPVINDDEELMAFVRSHLTGEFIAAIQRNYPEHHWRIEFEAFAGMHAYTADEIAEMFRKACLYTDA